MVAKQDWLARVQQLVAQHGSLFAAAEQQPRVAELRGRGVTLVVKVDTETWVVRHYRRGGSAAWLGDRYVRAGRPRSLRELRISSAARARGIATPEVMVAAWYEGVSFRRCDIALEYVPESRDLADVMFGDDARPEQIGQAAGLIGDCLRKGLLHRDLNLKNILLAPRQAFMLDLDRCSLVKSLSKAQIKRMRDRFFRSLTKWERNTGRPAPAESVQQLNEAFIV